MLHDEKERAEHVMLVDLGRNDLGRVSEYGSVNVRDLMYVERYSHVMHIVSALEGKLRERSGRARCFCGLFSRGNAERRAQSARHADHRGTGADAPRHLRRLCSLCRLCGQSGFLHRHPHHADAGQEGLSAGRRGHRGRLRPESEFQECMNKAQAVLRAVEAARGGG